MAAGWRRRQTPENIRFLLRPFAVPWQRNPFGARLRGPVACGGMTGNIRRMYVFAVAQGSPHAVTR